jgi:hypothetical protein
MQEAEASEPQVGSGGTRWKSARPDKGGVTTYARDVKDRQQRKAAERSIVATAEGTTAAAITTSTSTTSKQRESSSKQSSSMSAPAPKEQRVSKCMCIRIASHVTTRMRIKAYYLCSARRMDGG